MEINFLSLLAGIWFLPRIIECPEHEHLLHDSTNEQR
jgi:hypothetical protein